MTKKEDPKQHGNYKFDFTDTSFKEKFQQSATLFYTTIFIDVLALIVTIIFLREEIPKEINGESAPIAIVGLLILGFSSYSVFLWKICSNYYRKIGYIKGHSEGYEESELNYTSDIELKQIIDSVLNFRDELTKLGMKSHANEILAKLPQHPESWIQFIRFGYGGNHSNDILWKELTTNLICNYLDGLANVRGDGFNNKKIN